MLQLQITGNLGRDAAVKDVNGAEYLTFPLANQERKDGPTQWVNVMVRKAAGEDGRTRVWKTGVKVLVQGRPVFRSYVNKEGQAVATVDVWANAVEVLKWRDAEEAQATAAAAPTQAPAAPVADDPEKDLPF